MSKFKIGDVVKIKPNFNGIDNWGIGYDYIEKMIGHTFIIDKYTIEQTIRLKNDFFTWNPNLFVKVNKSNKCKKYK